jgi:hypothetical protein
MAKTVQVLLIPPDGHAVFTTPFRLDASFAMTICALRNCHPDAPSILRLKPVNLLPLGFEAQTGKLTTSDVDACPASRQLSQHFQDLSRSRRMGSLLELAIAFLPNLTDDLFIMSIYLLFRAPSELSMTLPGLLGSLGPSLLVSILHHSWSIGMNLSLDLHRIRRSRRRILHLHITSQEIHQIKFT